jgi:hypothetical protein
MVDSSLLLLLNYLDGVSGTIGLPLNRGLGRPFNEDALLKPWPNPDEACPIPV